MKCPNCKTLVEKGDAFCPECGSPISADRKRMKSSKLIPIMSITIVLVIALCFTGLYLSDKREDKVNAVSSKKTDKAESQLKGKRNEDTAAENMDEESQVTKKGQAHVEETQSDYLIADSNSRYLAYSDIGELSLKQINYAKNEIYARHGRKFKSAELTDYFNSKVWYEGKYDPDDFDVNYSPNVLNDYEKRNAELLTNKEYAVDPDGYALDAGL